MRARCILKCVAAIAAIGATAVAQDPEPTFTWGASIMGTRVEPINRPEVRVHYITERAGELVGACSLANVPDGTYQPVELQIRGQWRAEEFWPAVEYQVGERYKGPWQRIQPAQEAPEMTKLIVKPAQVVQDLWVSLEPFRKFIGKHAVGKVVLSSGDGGVFELHDLVPPK
jgi:hypothetical protein